MDFSGITSSITFSFDWKMSYYWMVYPYDKADLNVRVSTDKGQSWSGVLWVENYPGFFESFEWQNSTVDLTEFAGSEHVWIAFQYTGKDAASVYLDNVIIEDGSGGITSTDEQEKDQIKIYPNPFNDRITMSFASNQIASGQIRITDLQGKLIVTRPVDVIEGINQVFLDTDDLAPGMYLFSMEMPGGVLTKKMIRL
jgi:hypothetical protein